MKPQSYTVSVIANVTLMVDVVACDEVEASVIVEAMSYDELVRQCRIRIYSTEPVDPDEDVALSVDALIASILYDPSEVQS